MHTGEQRLLLELVICAAKDYDNDSADDCELSSECSACPLYGDIPFNNTIFKRRNDFIEHIETKQKYDISICKHHFRTAEEFLIKNGSIDFGGRDLTFIDICDILEVNHKEIRRLIITDTPEAVRLLRKYRGD